MLFKWYKKRRQEEKQLQRNINEIKKNITLINASRALNNENIFHFPMLGEEITLYLPFSSFDFIQSEILTKADFYEGSILRHVRRTYFSGTPCNVLDIGANIGNHSIFFSKFCNATVHSFEPQPAIFQILEKNIALNSVPVTPHQFALGQTEGRAEIQDYNPRNTGATAFNESTSGTFPIFPLDHFSFNNIYFIKLDVEGFENYTIRGAKETLRRNKPILWIEIGPEKFNEVSQLLDSYGYKIKEKLSNVDFVFTPK